MLPTGGTLADALTPADDLPDVTSVPDIDHTGVFVYPRHTRYTDGRDPEGAEEMATTRHQLTRRVRRAGRRGLQYDPNLVIVHFVLNDIVIVINWHRGPKVEFHQEPALLYQAPDLLCSSSYLWSWARQRFLDGHPALFATRPEQVSENADEPAR
jgi:hypothetical protein